MPGYNPDGSSAQEVLRERIRRRGTAADGEAPQTRRERRWSQGAQKEARADRARRRVRTTGGGKQKRPIVINVGRGGTGTRKRRGRTRRRVSKRFGVFAGLWLIIAACFAIAWWTTGLILWAIGSALMAVAGVMAAIATFDPDAAGPSKPTRKAPSASSRGNGSARPRRQQSGTAAQKPRKRVCSARCRNSTKPVSTCNCVCGGKTHGAKHKVG